MVNLFTSIGLFGFIVAVYFNNYRTGKINLTRHFIGQCFIEMIQVN